MGRSGTSTCSTVTYLLSHGCHWCVSPALSKSHGTAFSHSLVTKYSVFTLICLTLYLVSEMNYHPLTINLNLKNNSSANGLVSKSAFWSSVLQYWTLICLFFTWVLKWWYFRAICFVLGVNLSEWAILMHDWLSACTLQMKFSLLMWIGKTPCNSFIRSVISGITSLNDCDKAIYPASALFNRNGGISFLAGKKQKKHPMSTSSYVQDMTIDEAHNTQRVVVRRVRSKRVPWLCV